MNIQRIPRSHYVLAVGPVPYLYYLHQMRLLDMALMAFIAISLAFPVFIWMRPHWQDMLKPKRCAADSSFSMSCQCGRIQIKTGKASEMAIKAIRAISSRRIWCR